MPHDDVYVRLGISSIHGIGVFAIRPIPRGTNIFADDRGALAWVEVADLDAAEPTGAERRLYTDFGVRRGSRIGCPASFNHLTPGWYLNEPLSPGLPNVAVDERLDFRASRDIAKGEELTIRYGDFSDSRD